MVTWNVTLPTEEQLACPEIQFGGHVMKAGGKFLGKYCEGINDDFMMCRRELGPRFCIEEGKKVTQCTFNFFAKVKAVCAPQLDAYAYCLDQSSYDLSTQRCRKTQAAYENCMNDRMGIPTPDLAYFCRPRIYKGNRPKPEPDMPQIFEDVPPGPKDDDLPPVKKSHFAMRTFIQREQ